MKYVVRILVSLQLAVCPVLSATAQTCAPRHQFSFGDGEKGCLVDAPFARERIVGWSSTVEESTPMKGMYSIAASPRGGSCPAVVAMTFVKGGPNDLNGTVGLQTPVRSQTAIRDCQKQTDSEKAPDTACVCVLVLENASSKMTRSELNAFFASPVETGKK